MHVMLQILYYGANEQPNVIKFDNVNRTLSGDNPNDDPTATHR